MKTYPSIVNSGVGQQFRKFKAHVFNKLDGSNLRFEWSRKQGWYKYGTRKRLFDETDPVFGQAIKMFHDKYAQAIADIAKKQRWQAVVVYCEFYGDKSFAGFHEENDTFHLVLFDVAPYKQGIMSPKEFLKLFGKLDIPHYFGHFNWTKQFVRDVHDGKIEGVTFEGVVGKSKEGRHDLIMAKAKTRDWLDRVKEKFSSEEAEKIINS